MDKAPGAEVSSLLYGTKQGKSSWLEDFLVNGNDYNPFDPMDKVKISIPGNNGGGNKKKMQAAAILGAVLLRVRLIPDPQ